MEIDFVDTIRREIDKTIATETRPKATNTAGRDQVSFIYPTMCTATAPTPKVRTNLAP